MATRRVSDSQKTPKPMLSEPEPMVAPRAAEAAPKAKKRRPGAKKDQPVITADATLTVSADERRGMIALSAYLSAERRGFSPEGQAEDWLAAEEEVDALLNSGVSAPQ